MRVFPNVSVCLSGKGYSGTFEWGSSLVVKGVQRPKHTENRKMMLNNKQTNKNKNQANKKGKKNKTHNQT